MPHLGNYGKPTKGRRQGRRQGPAADPGLRQVPVNFGRAGKSVPMRPDVLTSAKAAGRKVFEDGSVGPRPSARAIERANPNAAFKRPVAPGAKPPAQPASRPASSPPTPEGGRRAAAATAAVQGPTTGYTQLPRKALPKPPAR